MDDNKDVVNNGSEVETTETNETVTMTREELNLLLQKEGDKRVTSALKKQEQKNANAVREAEKLARMNADEKFQYELEQREKAIEAKEKELALAENKNAASAILADKGISLRLVDFVVDTDADVMDARIKLLDSEFKKSVKAEVEKRLGSSIPKKNLAEEGSITKEQFSKMGLMERQELAREQPELYKSLRGK